jgi:hypothetical protein
MGMGAIRYYEDFTQYFKINYVNGPTRCTFYIFIYSTILFIYL